MPDTRVSKDRRDDASIDVLGDGWRIRWVGPRYLSNQTLDRKLPVGKNADVVQARVTDAEIGHRTLKPFDDKPIRFRYLLRVRVSFHYEGDKYSAIPISWQHEFESREDAHAFCQQKLGYDVPTNAPTEAAVEHQIEGAPGQPFELNISKAMPYLCWLSPQPTDRRVAAPFEIVKSLGEEELAAHKSKEHQTSPLLWGVKLAILIAVFVFLWTKFG